MSFFSCEKTLKERIEELEYEVKFHEEQRLIVMHIIQDLDKDLNSIKKRGKKK